MAEAGIKASKEDHGLPWGVLTALAVLLLAMTVIGKTVSDNSRAPVNSEVSSLQ